MSEQKTEYKGHIIADDIMGFSVQVPDLGGGLTYGGTREECLANCEEYLTGLVGDERFEVAVEPVGDDEEWTEFVVRPNVPALLERFDLTQRRDRAPEV